MPSAVLKTPTLKFLFMLKVRGKNNYEHFIFFPSEWQKSVRSVGFKPLKWHAEKQSVQYHAGIKKMSASCMLQSQYIESRGAMGKPGVHLEMKTTSDKYCSIIRWKGIVRLQWRAFICKQWARIGWVTKEEAHWIWHPCLFYLHPNTSPAALW